MKFISFYCISAGFIMILWSCNTASNFTTGTYHDCRCNKLFRLITYNEYPGSSISINSDSSVFFQTCAVRYNCRIQKLDSEYILKCHRAKWTVDSTQKYYPIDTTGGEFGKPLISFKKKQIILNFDKDDKQCFCRD